MKFGKLLDKDISDHFRISHHQKRLTKKVHPDKTKNTYDFTSPETIRTQIMSLNTQSSMLHGFSVSPFQKVCHHVGLEQWNWLLIYLPKHPAILPTPLSMKLRSNILLWKETNMLEVLFDFNNIYVVKLKLSSLVVINKYAPTRPILNKQMIINQRLTSKRTLPEFPKSGSGVGPLIPSLLNKVNGATQYLLIEKS